MFMNLSPDEAEAHFEYMFETTQSWDTSDPNDRNLKAKIGTNPNPNPNPNSLPLSPGLHHLKNEDDLQAKIAQLGMKSLEKAKRGVLA